jgi:biotin carboxyl carrier protein
MLATQQIMQPDNPKPENHMLRNVIIGIVVVVFLAFLTNAYGITTIIADALAKPEIKIDNNSNTNTNTNTNNNTNNNTNTNTNTNTNNNTNTNTNTEVIPAVVDGDTKTNVVISSNDTPAPPVIPTNPISSPLVGSFNADDNFAVLINGFDVYNTTGIKSSQQQMINIPNVKLGDQVTFAITNLSGLGGFIGSFTWNGKRYDINSALFPGMTDVYDIYDPESIWGPTNYPNTNAKWIWSTSNCKFCTIYFTWVAK